MNVSYILDTSALLAHYFDEIGAEIVQRLWESGGSKPGISAVTVAELKGRLDLEEGDRKEIESVCEAYLGELTTCMPVDRSVAELAWQIRAATPQRLPLVDALIAATARKAGAILVHKDPHMARIPEGLVKQLKLM